MTDDGQFGHVELELGASNEEINSLAYSVYSDSRSKLNRESEKKNLPVAGGPINFSQKPPTGQSGQYRRQISKNVKKPQISSTDNSRTETY